MRAHLAASDAAWPSDLEDEICAEVTEDTELETKRHLGRRIIVATVGGFALVACIALLFGMGGHREPVVSHRHTASSADASMDPRTSVSARELLESPELADACTSGFMIAGRTALKHEHRNLIRTQVTEGLRNFTASIAAQNPRMYRKLDTHMVSPQQRERAFKAVLGMMDPRVQQLGHEVGEEVLESRDEGKEQLRRRLHERFSPRAMELAQLGREVGLLSPRKAKMAGKPEVRPEKMNLFAMFPDGLDATARKEQRRLGGKIKKFLLDDLPGTENGYMSFGGHATAVMIEGLHVLAGIIEQTRVVLDQVDFVSDAFGKDAHIPYWSKSLVGGMAFISELALCVERSGMNLVKMTMCPFKYASAASDLFESIDNILGLDDPFAATPPPPTPAMR